MLEINEIRLEKLELLKNIKLLNNNMKSTHKIRDLLNISSEKNITTSGRIVNHRNSRLFLIIRSEENDIQCYLNKDSNIYPNKKLLDNGDIITIKGNLGLSNSGEKTIYVDNLYVQSKCLINVCDQYFLKQQDRFSLDYRTQYLAFDKNGFEKLKTRFHITQKIREYMFKNDIIEVETPILNQIAGGAIAKPFQVYYNSMHKNYDLRISPELYLKKLIIAGYEKIFEIAKNFRNEGLSINHNPEFSMMEIYLKEYKINDLINFSISLLNDINESTYQTYRYTIKYNFKDIITLDHKTIGENIMKDLKTDINDPEFKNICQKEYNIIPDNMTNDEYMSEIITKSIIPNQYSNNVVVLVNHPISISPLAEHNVDKNYAYRFEIYLNGTEVVDGYQENVEALKQKIIFEEQEKNFDRKSDMTYVNDMLLGMPRIGGIGIGIDRLVKTFINTNNIREVISYT